LFSNRLSYFKRLEENEIANRGDKHEGVVAWYQHQNVELELNGHIFKDIAAPISIQMNYLNNLNVFCMFAAHTGKFNEVSEQNIGDFKRQVEIPEDCNKLGEIAIVVTIPNKFIERVKAAVINNNFGLSAGLVEYYCPKTFHGSFSETESIFRKHSDFEHQKEYRFAFKTGTEGDSPLFLEIGDISDITIQCKVSDINKFLEVKIPGGVSA
jgi:hypothetical protein